MISTRALALAQSSYRPPSLWSFIDGACEALRPFTASIIPTGGLSTRIRG